MATDTARNTTHSTPTLTPAKARIVATSAPNANGARKNDPGDAISPMANTAVATSQTQRHSSGVSIALQCTPPRLNG